MKALSSILLSMFMFPSESGRGIYCVWKRNFLYFRKTFLISFLWVLLEPIFYLVAIGFGVGQLVGQVGDQSYLEFFFPALMLTSGMMVSYFEATYGSYTRLSTQKTFESIMVTPVSTQEIAQGEIYWATSKGLLSVLAVLLVGGFLGLVNTWTYLYVLVVAAILCKVFAAFGLLMSSVAKDYNSFIYSQTGLMIPMTLFSGTYFPLEQMPVVFQKLAYILPLTHGLLATRGIIAHQWEPMVFVSIAALLVFSTALSNMAVYKLNKRLVY